MFLRADRGDGGWRERETRGFRLRVGEETERERDSFSRFGSEGEVEGREEGREGEEE
jgi:hypothetical protein